MFNSNVFNKANAKNVYASQVSIVKMIWTEEKKVMTEQSALAKKDADQVKAFVSAYKAGRLAKAEAEKAVREEVKAGMKEKLGVVLTGPVSDTEARAKAA